MTAQEVVESHSQAQTFKAYITMTANSTTSSPDRLPGSRTGAYTVVLPIVSEHCWFFTPAFPLLFIYGLETNSSACCNLSKQKTVPAVSFRGSSSSRCTGTGCTGEALPSGEPERASYKALLVKVTLASLWKLSCCRGQQSWLGKLCR